MKVNLKKPAAEDIERAAVVVRSGGLVCYPADTIYGLGCDPHNAEAVRRLCALKGRPSGQGLLCLVPDARAAAALSADWTPVAARLAARFWPGPVTLVAAAPPGLPEPLVGRRRTIGLRCPDSLFLQLWLAALGGPLVSTSANRSGLEELADIDRIRDVFGEAIDLYVEAPGFTPGVASTVVDLTGTRPAIVRRGAEAEAVEAALLEVRK